MSSFLKARLLTTIFLLQQDKAKYKFCLSEYHLTTGASKKGAPVFFVPWYWKIFSKFVLLSLIIKCL